MGPLRHHAGVVERSGTSLPDRRIGQGKLDDWLTLRRFYAVMARRGKSPDRGLSPALRHLWASHQVPRLPSSAHRSY